MQTVEMKPLQINDQIARDNWSNDLEFVYLLIPTNYHCCWMILVDKANMALDRLLWREAVCQICIQTSVKIVSVSLTGMLGQKSAFHIAPERNEAFVMDIKL